MQETLKQTIGQQEWKEAKEQEENFRQKTYNKNLDYMEVDRNNLEE